MKCMNCGKEMKDGALYCDHCGKEVQIVPDYNVYEEDEFLKQAMSESDRRRAAMANQKKAPKINKTLMLIIALAVVVFILVIVIACMYSASVDKERANSFEYQLLYAKEAESAGNIDEAIKYYDNALALDKDNIDVRLILVDIYLKRKDYDSAMMHCYEVLQLDSSNKKACETLISIYEMQKNYDAILSLYDKVDKGLSSLFVDYMVTPPDFNVEAGVLEEFGRIKLSTAGDFEIYYTLDGSDPTLRGERYTDPIELNENYKTYTISAVCMNDKGLYSELVTKEFTIQIPAPGLPVVTPDGGEFAEETMVSIYVPEGCSAYYTWDGTEPNAFCEKYTEPMVIPEGNNLLGVIIIDDRTQLYSEIYRGNFIYYSDNDEGEYIDDAEDLDE